MVYDNSQGKLVPTENWEEEWQEVSGSGLGKATEDDDDMMNRDAQNPLKVRVRKRATSNYQQRVPTELNADLDVGYHEIKDT